MTKLTINICAADDERAIRVLSRIEDLLRQDEALNEAGYSVSHVDGSATCEVRHLQDVAGEAGGETFTLEIETRARKGG